LQEAYRAFSLLEKTPIDAVALLYTYSENAPAFRREIQQTVKAPQPAKLIDEESGTRTAATQKLRHL